MRVGIAVLLSIVLALAVPGLAAPVRSDAPDPVLWPEEQRAFFQDGPGLLLTDAQQAELLRKDEAGRGALVHEWLDRDPIPETPANELQLGVERRRRLGLLAFGTSTDARFQLLFLRGLPAARKVIPCRVLNPLEIWDYGAPDPRRLIVYRPSSGEPFRLWLPVDSKRDLYVPEGRNPALLPGGREACPEAAEVESAIGAMGAMGAAGPLPALPAEQLQKMPPAERMRVVLRPADLGAWARAAAETPLPPEPGRLATGALELDFPRWQKNRLAVRVLVPVGSRPAASLSIRAVVENQARAVEERWLRYRIPARVPAGMGHEVPLFLELSLPPDLSYLLRLRIRDDASGAEALVARGFQTPSQPASRLGAAVSAAVWGEPLSREDRVGPDSLVLPPPPDPAALGTWRVEPLVTGDHIVKVVFLVDGEAQASLSRRPFAAELRLPPGPPPAPREPLVRAEGYDENGELVAIDQVVLHRQRDGAAGSSDTFGVKLVEPAPGSAAAGGVAKGAAGGAVRARAEVTVPAGRRVESLEIRLNDKTVATLAAPPWEARVDVPAREEVVFLSVVARLDDGRQAEDTRFLRAPENLEQMNVRLVELSTRVTDRSGHLVPDLEAGDFEVLEDGKPQTLARFELFKDLRLNLGIVVDTSGSMLSSLAEAQRAAAGFLHRVLGPQDRSFILGFGNRPYLLAAPPGEAGAPAGTRAPLPVLRASGGTALYDAVVTAISELRSGRGQRALVLLSDGVDTASFTTFQQALEMAQRGGVTVYVIGFVPPAVINPSDLTLENLGSGLTGTQERLSRLAEGTGGRVWFISQARDLDGVYGRIEEDLRGRYLLAYQTEHEDEKGSPDVEVRVRKRGLKVRTVLGYYP